jgi:hypothetical protein
VYSFVKGPIKDGDVIRHTCDNKCCINPDHLIAGTQAENIKDIYDRGRQQRERKITRDLFPQIKQEFDSGVSAYRLGPKYGVSATTMRRWLKKIEKGGQRGET